MKSSANSFSFVILTVGLAVSFCAGAAVSDFTRTEKLRCNGYEGASYVTYKKSSNGAAAYLFKFDLTKGFRIRTWLGDTNEKGAQKATLGTMAENLAANAGALPIAGVNGDYYRMQDDEARPTGLAVSDSALVHSGWSSGNSTDYCYFAELGDHNLYHGKLDCAGGFPGGDPTQPWQVGALGRKVRNAIRTNYHNYPVKGGVINPVGGGTSSDGYAFSTTIGNYQSRNTYYRTLVGIGTNETGVATNLVIFTSKSGGVLGVFGADFPDVDAYQMMIDEGCNEVGELDGGGSATMWAQSTENGVAFEGSTTANGGYVMKPENGSPRKIANGLFVMPPPSVPDAYSVNEVNTYPTLEEARRVATSVTSDTVAEINQERPRRGVCKSGVGIVWDPYITFGVQSQNVTNFFTRGYVAVEVTSQVAYIDGASLRMTVKDASGKTLCVVSKTLSGPGTYEFNIPRTALRDAHGAGSLRNSCTFEVVGVSDDGTTPVLQSIAATLSLTANGIWFMAEAGVPMGGAWLEHLSFSDGTYLVRPGEKASFKAFAAKDGVVRIESEIVPAGGYDADMLELQRARFVEEGRQAALVIGEKDGELVPYGLVRVGENVELQRLYGVSFTAGEALRIAIEIDYTKTSPRVSYLVSAGAEHPLARLRDVNGIEWLDAAVADATSLAGKVEVSGNVKLASLNGFTGETPPSRKLQYIQADGIDDFIDLGVIGKDGLKMEAVMEWDGEAGTPVFCGSSTDSSVGRFWLYGRSTKTQRMGYLSFGDTITGSSYPIAKGEKYRITTMLDAGAQSVACVKSEGNTAYGNRNSDRAGPNDTRLSLYLFADNCRGEATSFASAKCYSFKLWRKDANGQYSILVRNLIPVKDPVNGGNPAFYDLVNGTYFRNGGSGDFARGTQEEPLYEFKTYGFVLKVQ